MPLIRRKRTRLFKESYVNALELLLDGNEAKGLDMLKKAVREDPSNFKAYLRLGTLLRNRGRISSAVRIHLEQKVRPRLQRNDRKELMFELARDYRTAGDLDKASDIIEKLLKLDRKLEKGYRLLFDIHEEEKKWEEAYFVLEELGRMTGSTDRKFLAKYKAFIGKTEIDRGNLKAAGEHLKKSLKLDRNCVSALFYLGEIYRLKGNWRKALSAWSKILDNDPGSASIVLGRLEKAYFEIGEFEKLFSLYASLVEAVPNDIQIHLALADLYRKKGKHHEALSTCDRILTLDPNSTAARTLRVMLYVENGETDKALGASLALFPEASVSSSKYGCTWCGHEPEDFLWRCPVCSRWDTFKIQS